MASGLVLSLDTMGAATSVPFSAFILLEPKEKL